MYKKVKVANPNSPGFSHCLSTRDCFIAQSLAGPHICFVTDPLSSSLEGLRPPGQNKFTVPIAKRIIKQVLLALDYLHRECGFIHAGGSESALVPIHTDDHILRSQSRQHPCHNPSPSNPTNRRIHSVKPCAHLWPPPQAKVIIFTSHLRLFATSPVARPWGIS